jgi:hypothetical protein
MNNATVIKPESALQRESRILKEQINRLTGWMLNGIFDLSMSSARRRGALLGFLFILIGFLFGLRIHPLSDWTQALQGLFSAILVSVDPNAISVALNHLFTIILESYLAPETLRYLPVVAIPFLIAWQMAALYLADIFELEHVGVAREFLMQVALTGSMRFIRVSQGEIIEKHRESPIAQIGGPGRVLVDLDSAALFEKPDGTPHIIGPTIDEPQKLATLEGFERFREAIDLRDHYTDSWSVVGRSLDGIPVIAKDVRNLFSVQRGDVPNGTAPTLKRPYPFKPSAIHDLIYKQSCRVTVGTPRPSQCTPWTGNMTTLVRNEMRSFIGRHPLSEFLASIGMPELQSAQEQEQALADERQQLAAPSDTPRPPADIGNLPPFEARHKISSLFNQFAQDFTNQSQRNGVELHWIGVGTWVTPSELISERHLEAWRISRDNMTRSADLSMNMLRLNSSLQENLRIIQDILLAYRKNLADPRSDQAMRQLLLVYLGQLEDALEKERQRPAAEQDAGLIDQLEEATRHIFNQFGHSPGNGGIYG